MSYVKPKIVLVRPLAKNGWKEEEGRWLCHNDYRITAQGDSPGAAYALWKTKMLTLTKIPRKGIWNKQSVIRWFLGGCKGAGIYLGRKRISGYVPVTDELVLQGF